MLRQVLALLQQTGGVPLSVDDIGRQLGVPRDVADHLVRTLVQRGRLVEVDEGCAGCTSCPLKAVCAGAPAVSAHGCALVERSSSPVSQSWNPQRTKTAV